MIILGVSFSLWASPIPASAPTEIIPYEVRLEMVQENSLVASKIPYFYAKNGSLASFSGKDDILYLIKGKYPEMADLLLKLALCESSLNPQMKGKRGEVGLFQYLPSTWIFFNKMRGTSLDINNSEHQIDMTKWALEKGYQSHWTCWRKFDQ